MSKKIMSGQYWKKNRICAHFFLNTDNFTLTGALLNK